jgi:hypothetical protein
MRTPHQNTVYTSPILYTNCTPCRSLSFLFHYLENLVRSTELKAPQEQQQQLALALGKMEETFVAIGDQ